MEWNEMNLALGHFCAHTGYIGPGEPPEDGDMSKMNEKYKETIEQHKS